MDLCGREGELGEIHLREPIPVVHWLQATASCWLLEFLEASGSRPLQESRRWSHAVARVGSSFSKWEAHEAIGNATDCRPGTTLHFISFGLPKASGSVSRRILPPPGLPARGHAWNPI